MQDPNVTNSKTEYTENSAKGTDIEKKSYIPHNNSTQDSNVPNNQTKLTKNRA